MTENAVIEKGTLTMGVDGPGLTHLVREVWVEGEAEKAMNILVNGVGLSREQAFEVLEGRLKLVNVERAVLTLEEDNAFECCGLSLRTEDVVARAKAKEPPPPPPPPTGKYGQPIGDPEAFERWRAEREERYYAARREAWGFDDDDHLDDEEEEVKDRMETVPLDLDPLRAMADPMGFMQSYMAHQSAIADHETAPDPELELPEGWLSPEGVYYGCLYMEHKKVAYDLDEELDLQAQVEWDENDFKDADTAMEKLGWVKIFQSLISGEQHLWTWRYERDEDRGLTEAQKAVMDRYKAKWGKLTSFLSKEEWGG